MIALILTTLLSFASAERALVLARKTITSEFNQEFNGESLGNMLVEGRNFTVTVTLYNVGTQEAFEIEVEDEWEEDKFTTMDGSMRAAFTRLAPGANVEYSFVLSPQFSTTKSLYEYHPAMVTYMYGEEDEQIETIAHSSRPHTHMPGKGIYDGKTLIISEAEYSTLAQNFEEWTVFSVACVPLICLPFVFWFSLNLASDSSTKKSN